MSLQHDGKSSGTTEKSSTRSPKSLEDDKDWNPKMEDVEVSSREAGLGNAKSRFDNKPDPVTDLKQRLSMWGKLLHWR
jgi:hypothetical protein